LAQTNADCPIYGVQASGAKYCISVPPDGFWNGDLVIFAHGYVSVKDPLDIPWSQMTFSDGMGGVITMPTVVNGMGYAFATTSYSVNGLAVKEGIADILDLVDVFRAKAAAPNQIYLIGASEGGLVTTLGIEQHPEAFTGGLALCGPIGSFRKQVNYWGDFRVVFDYFMDTPTFDVLPGTAVNIPQALMAKWDPFYSGRVANVLAAKPLKTQQLLSVTQAAFDPMKPTTIGETTLGILWYNVFATNDAIAKLGGQPYDNRNRVYTGSFNDALLNARVKRFTAKPAALAEIAANYETAGILLKPLVTMHTTGDPIVPAWHQTLYTNKVLSKNPLALNTLYLPMTIPAYGHCTFTLDQMETGFGALVVMSGGVPPVLPLTQQADASSYRLGQ
jgi:pimeloyl-ACP methyl ester carboxylesterase